LEEKLRKRKKRYGSSYIYPKGGSKLTRKKRGALPHKREESLFSGNRKSCGS